MSSCDTVTASQSRWQWAAVPYISPLPRTFTTTFKFASNTYTSTQPKSNATSYYSGLAITAAHTDIVTAHLLTFLMILQDVSFQLGSDVQLAHANQSILNLFSSQ